MTAAVILALFLLGNKFATKMFDAFVILLFIDVFIEINILHSTEYQKIFGIITSLYFLGFAFFATIKMFVKKSKNDYKVMERLFVQVKDTQSLLVQKEKMVVLGELVASVAHEINTPMGLSKLLLKI